MTWKRVRASAVKNVPASLCPCIHAVSSTEDEDIKSLSPCDTHPAITNWVGMLMLACNQHTQTFLAAKPEEKSSLFPEVSELWHQFADISKVCKPTAMKTVIDQFISTDNIWRTLYKFLSLLFKAGTCITLSTCMHIAISTHLISLNFLTLEISGLGTRDIQVCLLRLLSLLRDWTGLSKQFCQVLLDSGYLIYHCSQLLELTQQSCTKVYNVVDLCK